MSKTNVMKFLIITGRSGSGKSSCLHLLEDLGYYCIDNLPISLLTSLPSHLEDKEKIAIGIDVRNLPINEIDLENSLSELHTMKVNLEVIYLDTDEKILMERFSSTRRKHPLTNENTPLEEALSIELERLEPLAHMAKYRIDTTRLSIHELQARLRSITQSTSNDICLLFQSFGYKYGLPRDSDYVFDVRSLPNPYWDASLRSYKGYEIPIIDFLKNDPKVKAMLKDLEHFIERWLPEFREDNRSYMTISIGCTGGHHRSVYIAEALYKHFKSNDVNVQLRHRELN